MADQILLEEDYIKILQIKFKTKSIYFKSAELTPLSDTIEGFMGDHYILKLKYILNNQENDEIFFLKTRPMKTKIQTEMAFDFIPFEKEIFLYSNLLKEFEKLNYDITFAPKSYYCKNNDTLVMEDLKLTGFILSERNAFYDINHCKMALNALATYHANSISYEEYKTKETGKIFRVNEGRHDIFKETLFIPDVKKGLAYEFVNSAYKCFLKLLHTMPESSEWKHSFKQKLKYFDVNKCFMEPLPYRKACGHGDLWSNNMLFKYSNGVPIHCCLVDFQLLRHHHPSFDVLLMLYENTSRDFRKKYMYELLDYYYDTFDMIMKRNGFEAKGILPKDHFLNSAQHLEPVALFQAAATRQIILIPSKVLSSAVHSGGDDLKNIMFSKKRADLVLEGMETDDHFRNIIYDDLYDLYEHF